MVTELGALTVTTQEAWYPPSSDVAVMVSVPALITLTTPALVTVATVGSEDVQEAMLLFVAFDGLNLGTSVLVYPTPTVAFASDMPWSAVGSTVITQVAETEPP